MWRKIRTLLEMIKFEHTIFALPFAFMGAVLAARGIPEARTSLLILGAMVGARTAAMAFNRLVDLSFDAANPRTQNRPLVTGEVRPGETWAMILIASALFFFCAWRLNSLTLKLSPLALAILLAYSYTKRFTWLCHVFLGLAIGLSPLAGWIAVTGAFSWEPAILSLGVMFWVAGFDILYACLDEEFDRKVGLYSIPARFGRRRAFAISALFHSLAFGLFVLVGLLLSLGWIYYLGLTVTLGLFIAQRVVISPDDLSKMDLSFFTFNGAISVVMFLATVFSLIF
ncbi:UbiA family prenyltransferase [Thermosulfuriphilus ammonigenes]|uniref:4-hydroxybenzoate polyprenyltransferase n=1 Tax=Thermosulfuriphilus ammonigenes TaxID=1936021 RepID=A0A6G7PUN1_9BACT|nr:UbiA-like polyprenyltransferase [Thermosulfuriphilus ammonigenes]MBA2848455.1 4-hydroxybenzoate polyprenyltransferase [Thermosulfuriphilus ammonigenes]QIJ71394.1 UbiA family prenyltransferase [Thermosulfuriphilus ammonigenes]